MAQTDNTDVWRNLLELGEKLEWSGRPDTSLHFRRSEWPALVIVASLVGVSTLAIYASIEGGAPLWFALLFSALGVFGILILPVQMMNARNARKRMRYALTNKRALILSMKEPKELLSYPLAETNRLDVAAYAGGLSVLYFKDEHATVDGKVVMARHPYEIAFDYIEGGEQLRDRMADLGAGRGPNLSARTTPVLVD